MLGDVQDILIAQITDAFSVITEVETKFKAIPAPFTAAETETGTAMLLGGSGARHE